MSNRHTTTIMGYSFGRDPLDDPLVGAWDAIVTNTPSATEADSADTSLLRRFHALETIPAPSSGFFDELEQRLVRSSPVSTNTESVIPSAAEGSLVVSRALVQSIPERRTPGRPGWIPRHAFRVPQSRAAAGLVLLLAAGLLVLYFAIPGSSQPPAIPAAIVPTPTMETMVRFDFEPPLWGMPDATTWTHMDFGIIQLDPGKSFSTDTGWYISAGGPLLLMVLSGQLTMQPAGPSVFYPPGRPHQPEQIAPGSTVSLDPFGAIAYSITDAGTGTNPGSEPMIALIGLAGKEDLSMPFFQPDDVHSLDFNYADRMPVLPTTGASVSIQRLELAPYDAFVFEPDAMMRYLPAFDRSTVQGLRMSLGAVDALSPNEKSSSVYYSGQLTLLGTGTHTIFYLGEKTVDLYFFVVEPLPGAGTPTP